MNHSQLIVVTGAMGFIGSCMVSRLNRAGYSNLILVDDFLQERKAGNLLGKRFKEKIQREVFSTWLEQHSGTIDFVIHLGARTDTTESDFEIFDRLNLNYSKMIWHHCVHQNIPLIYASSAATYGDGALGYLDDLKLSPRLQPLNAYGISKNEFDKWLLAQTRFPPFWAGLKFFNVYGPNEFHKGRMASVIFHAFNQIRDSGFVNLFRAHRPDFQDGGQKRDFIYVMDVIRVCLWLMESRPASGLYNLGTGKARTFWDLATSVFKAVGEDPDIRFIDTPLDIRDKYQYFTEAPMEKLRKAGFTEPFTVLEAGVQDYVQNYLMSHSYF